MRPRASSALARARSRAARTSLLLGGVHVGDPKAALLAGLGIGDLKRAKDAAVAAALARWHAALALGEVAQRAQRALAGLVAKALAKAGHRPQRDDEAKPGPVCLAERLEVAKRGVGDHEQPLGQELAQALQAAADHLKLRRRPGSRAQVERHPLSARRLQDADLAGDPALGRPALLDQRRVLVGAGDAQRGQVEVKAGGVESEALDRPQHDRAAQLLGVRAERLQAAPEAIVVEQLVGNPEQLVDRCARGPAGDVVERRGRGQAAGDQRHHHLSRGELVAPAAGQQPVDLLADPNRPGEVLDQQQGADLAADPSERWVEPREGARQLLELARRLQLVLTPQRLQHPVADLAPLVAVGLDQAQVDVTPLAAPNGVTLDVHVGPTLLAPPDGSYMDIRKELALRHKTCQPAPPGSGPALTSAASQPLRQIATASAPQTVRKPNPSIHANCGRWS